MEQLSDIQHKIHAFIVRSIQTEGMPPTNREIGRALGISSTGHVEHHLRMLEKKGWITRIPGKGRGIKLPQGSTGIPLKGTIAAGVPLDIFPGPPQFLPGVEHLFSHSESLYALQVRGASMIEEHICDGDYVVIQPETLYQDGDVLVATHLQEGENGSATLKRIFREADGIRLQPANAAMVSTHIPQSEWEREWKIQGKVVAILRSEF